MKTKRPIPFSAWEPDKGRSAGAMLAAKGVISQSGRYAPLQSLSVYKAGTAHNDAVIGGNTFYDTTGNAYTFTADRGRLYVLRDKAPVDVTPIAGLSYDADWQVTFGQFNNYVLAFGRGPFPHAFEMGVSDRFSIVAGAPAAEVGGRIRDHMFGCWGLNIAWSAFNNPLNWDVTDGSTQAGEFARGQEQGIATAIVGGETGLLLRERGGLRVTYQGGTAPWFFDDIGGPGACSPGAVSPIEVNGSRCFICSESGFFFYNGAEFEPIGAAKVNQHFLSRLNYAYRGRITSCIDGTKKCWMVAIPSGASTVANFQFIYSWEDGRWSYDEMDVQHLLEMPRGGISADDEAGLIEMFGTANADAINVSVDSPAFRESRRAWAAVGTDRQIQTFTGKNRKAVLSTGETEPNPTMQSKVTEIWPVTDAPPGTMQVKTYGRNTLSEAESLKAVASVNQRGIAKPKKAKARFMRHELEIAASASWGEGVGLHTDTTMAGGRSGDA